MKINILRLIGVKNHLNIDFLYKGEINVDAWFTV